MKTALTKAVFCYRLTCYVHCQILKQRRKLVNKAQKFIHHKLSHLALLVFYVAGHFVYRLQNKFKFVGRDNVPKGVRILFVPNHRELIDSFGVGASAFTFMDLLFHYDRIPWNTPDKGNFFRNGIYRFVFGLLKNVPIVRGEKTREAIQGQIDRLVKVLDDSNLVLFFEGTRSRDNNIGPCKSGVQLVVQEAKRLYGDSFQVVPIRIVSDERIMPIEVGFNWRKLRFGVKGKIIIGKPIAFSEEELDNRKLLGTRIRNEVIDLYP